MGDETPTPLEVLEQARSSMRKGALDAEVAETGKQPSATLWKEEPWAAVLVTAAGASQQGWSRREEVSEALFEKLRALKGPSIEEALHAEFREVDQSEAPQPMLCSHCRIRPGFGPCPRCSGVGVLIEQRPGSDAQQVLDCPDCVDGFATCTVCGGTRKTLSVNLHYVTRKPLSGRHLVLPDPSLPVDGVLNSIHSSEQQPHPALRIDVDADAGGTAYRGVQPGAGSDFRGYRLGRAPQLARAFADRVRSAPNFLLRDLRAFAIPFVLATFSLTVGTARIVLYVDADGAPRFRAL